MTFDSNKIKDLLNNDWRNSVLIEVLSSTSSTNDYLKNVFGDDYFRVCMAEEQTGGRGRLDHAWYSPFGENLYLSLKHRFNLDQNTLSGIGLVTALAIIKTLEQYGLKNELFIKWPNDILWQAKKLAGILVEIEKKSENSFDVIIGIGLNVNMLIVPENVIFQPWTSLKLILSKDIDRVGLAGNIINKLLEAIEKFKLFGLSYFLNLWGRYDYLYGKEIEVQNADNRITGKMMGINSVGYMKLETHDGKTLIFSSGETRVLNLIKWPK